MSWITLFSLATSYRLSRCPYEIATQKYSQISNIRPTKFQTLRCLSSSLTAVFAQFIDVRCYNAGTDRDLYYIARCDTSVKFPDMAILDHCVLHLQVSKPWLFQPKKKICCQTLHLDYTTNSFVYYDAVLSRKNTRTAGINKSALPLCSQTSQVGV